jgi:hypothetical protein
MFLNIFKYFFLKKASYEQIKSILKKENFSYTAQDIENLLKGNQKGVRYGNVVLERKESGQTKKRFLKIMLDGTLRTYKLFCRQVEVADALNKDEKIKSPTMAVVRYSLNSPVPYSIFETRENGEDFGFMNDSHSFYQKFTDKEMDSLVDTIYSFHMSGADINPQVWKYTQDISSNLNFYKKEFKELLNTKITHKSADGKILDETVKKLLAFYTGISEVENSIMHILEENWKSVVSSKMKNSYYLVHADMQIDNVYKHKSGDFELLDFEWVGRTDSPVVAIMFDYGNLRARAWSSPSFQVMLDKAMLTMGKKYYQDENIIKAGLNLGILRSSLLMSRYHLDFKNTVKKDKRTEEDYQEMYPKTIASLINVL